MKSLAIIAIRSLLFLAGAAVIAAAVAVYPAAASGARAFVKAFGTTCSSSSPCDQVENLGSGAAIEGNGTKGSGLVATSNKAPGLFSKSTDGTGGTFVSATSYGIYATTSNKSSVTGLARYGVYGSDVSNDGGTLNVGVFGSSAAGVGVEGASSTNSGVFGTTFAFSGPAAGVTGTAPQQQGNASGVYGQSNGGPGVTGQSNSPGNPGVFGENMGKGDAIDAFGMGSGEGLNAFSNYIAVVAENSIGDGNPVEQIYGGTVSPTDTSLATYDSSSSATFWVDNGGNAHVRDLLFTGGPCSAGCIKVNGRAARVVQRYVPQESVPTVEDMGEAQLVNGAAYIRIAPDFGNVIDAKSTYLVFVTPQGATRGLYVASKSAAGFEVHEVGGGNGSIAFDYRIVAKPYGVSAQRLPTIDAAHLPPAPRRIKVRSRP